MIVTVSEGDRLRQARDRASMWLERYDHNHEPDDLRAATLRVQDFLDARGERRKQPRHPQLRVIFGGKPQD